MTTDLSSITCTSFEGHRCIASGSLQEVAAVVRSVVASGSLNPILIFDDATGKIIDMDRRGSLVDIAARNIPAVLPTEDQNSNSDKLRERGRPKLGVVAREVTLHPRHWDWLATQPGGASVTLRKLVEEARRANSDKDKIRNAQNRAYCFMSAIAGDMPGFEEATRALFANDPVRYRELIAVWPADVREYAIRLAFESPNSAAPEVR